MKNQIKVYLYILRLTEHRVRTVRQPMPWVCVIQMSHSTFKRPYDNRLIILPRSKKKGNVKLSMAAARLVYSPRWEAGAGIANIDLSVPHFGHV